MKFASALFILMMGFSSFSYAQYVNPQAGYSNNPVQRNCRITSQSDVTVTSASGGDVLISENFLRRCLIVVNKGASTAFIQYDTAPTSSTGGWYLAASGGAWEATVVPINKLYGITSSGSTTLTVMEGTYP